MTHFESKTMNKRELCHVHANELKATKLFGGKPHEEPMTPSADVPCGIETIRLGGHTTRKRVNVCRQPAEFRFTFGGIQPIERVGKKRA
jgi:hypothetical protein